jgi:hypothetical protein
MSTLSLTLNQEEHPLGEYRNTEYCLVLSTQVSQCEHTTTAENQAIHINMLIHSPLP